VPGYRTVSRFKQNTVWPRGVAIFEKEEWSSSLRSAEHDLLKHDREALQVKRLATAHDGVGDICAVETQIDGKRVLLISVYITPRTNSLETRDFFELNLMVYKPKLLDVIDIVKRRGYDQIPIVLVGDLNIDLNSTCGHELILFICEKFCLELNNNPTISTTRNRMTIDTVFSHQIYYLTTKHYISYIPIIDRSWV